MGKARISPVEAPYSEEVQASFDKLMPPGVEPIRLFRTVAHNPRVLRRMQRGGLLDPGSISLRERELVILRTTARCGAEYEWGVHVAFFAQQADLSRADIARTVHGAPSDWSDEKDSLLISLADALHDESSVTDALWQRIAAFWTDEQVIELVMLAGLYHAVSFVCTTTQVQLEPGGLRFPAA